MARYSTIIYRLLVIIGWLILLQSNRGSAQSISGFTCVAGGNTYGPYTINGVSWSTADKWCVTGGTINGSGTSCMNNNGAPSIGITWNSGATSGTVAYYSPASASTPIATLTVSFHNAGGISPAGNMFQPPNTPVNVSFNSTSPATTCNGSAIGYQWQQQIGSGSWTNISGANSVSLSLTGVSFSQTTAFRRAAYSVSDASRLFYTNPLPIVIAAAGTVTPASQTIGTSSTPTALTATSASSCNGAFNYLWQISSNGTTGWTNIPGATALSYTPPTPLPAVSYYRLSCFCTGTSATVYTNVAVINVTTPLSSGTVSPAGQTININTVGALLTATAASGGNGGFTYQWQSSPNGSSWSNISGATGLTYSPGVLSATTYYRMASTSNGETVYSNTATVAISSTTLYGVYLPNNSVGSADATMNWVITRGFNEAGTVVSEGKQFFDNNGRPLQVQQKVKYRSNASTVYTHVLASQPVTDAYGRSAISTLAAPIDNSEFIYKPNFVQAADGSNYTYKHFDRFNPSGTETDKTNNPDPVGAANRGTLGWYFSNNNIWEPYVPTTGYPYSRKTYYRDGSGNVKAQAGPGEAFRPGSGHEVSSYVFPITGEYTHYLQVRNKYFTSSEVGNLPTQLFHQATLTVSRDADGREHFTMTDRGGKTLMMARPGSDISLACNVTIAGDGRYGDQTVVIDSDDRLLMDPAAAVTVRVGSTVFYQGAASGFSIGSLGAQTATVYSSTPFSYQSCTGSTCGAVKAAPPAPPFHYVRILANSTPVVITGSYTLVDLNTEQAISFNGSSLNKGYYKLIANSGEVSMQYSIGLTDISYYFHNQLGQLVATIAPEGVKKLIQQINAYATRNDVPFINQHVYDLQGRLIKTTSTDGGASEMVYRQDGKIRFSQNAEQKLSGRYNYIHYDANGRAVESGEYQPDGSGIAFNSDLAVSSAMKSILENTTATGGLTTGTRRDVVITQYDQTNNSHGLTGYTQDLLYLRGVVSNTRKYSVVVNNTPNSNDLISSSWYSYDEEGKEVWSIKYIKDLGYKTTDYTYDVMGRLTKKVYQKNTAAETFVHYYEYDPATQQVWKVYTNTTDNAATRQLHATYIYYLHGPLKRIELATNLQGIDYTYTLQGTLKAVNNSDHTKDPGGDGSNGVAADAYGEVLDYYTDDYVNGRSGIQPIKGVNTLGQATDSYTGQLKAMTWYSKKPPAAGVTDAPTTYVFKYDEKNQFIESTWGTGLNFGNTPATFTATGFNKETVKHPTTGVPAYDAHGNIQYLQRTNGAGALAERFKYNYQTNTNKLQSIENDASGTVQTYASYTYNALGQLTAENTHDPAKRKYISYDATGRVLAVARDAAFTQKVVEYVYDEMGQRIAKKLYNSSYQLSHTTFYSGDAVYTQVTGSSIVPQEFEVSGGSSRLAIYYRPSNIYAYELVDHQGGVRAIIASSGSTYEVRMYSDYYPFGTVIRQYTSPEGARYGFQGQFAEKDGETDWNAFELRMYDARIGRWLSTDPEGQYYSPYAGMGNNPANGTDKDGGIFGALIGAIVGGAIEGTIAWANGGDFWQGAKRGAVRGAIAGAVFDAAYTGGASIVVAGALSGVYGELADQAFFGDGKVHVDRLIVAGVTGGVAPMVMNYVAGAWGAWVRSASGRMVRGRIEVGPLQNLGIVDDEALAAAQAGKAPTTPAAPGSNVPAPGTLAAQVQAKINLYPQVIDPRTGLYIKLPHVQGVVPKNMRVTWGSNERAAYIREWYNKGYTTPKGGWDKYDIHHIQPREYGGTNDFWNLVPVERTTHQNLFNNFWRLFGGL